MSSFKRVPNLERIAAYAEKPLNQKARLPPHLDATWLNREHVRPLKRRLRLLDCTVAACSVLAVILMQILVQSIQPVIPKCLEEYKLSDHKYVCGGFCTAIRVLILLVSLVTVGLLFVRYQTQVQIIRYQLNYS